MGEWQIIEDNLFALYRLFGQQAQYIHHKGPGYEYVRSETNEWPNYIFNLEDLSQLNTDAPGFLISHHSKITESIQNGITKKGFRPVMRWPAMYSDLIELQKKEDRLDLKLVFADTPALIKQWLGLVLPILFSKQGIESTLLYNLIKKNKIFLPLLLKNTIPLAGNLLYPYKNTVGVYCCVTHPNHRKLGYMEQLLAKSAQFALSQFLDIEFAVLQANQLSHGLYKKLGFNDDGFFDIYWKVKA